MRTRMVEVREGDAVGPIDWEHEWAKDKPPIWREAEADPGRFLFNDREIIQIAMYDGWPYWKPQPAVQFIGPLKRSEWAHFNSYGVYPNSISRKERG